MQAPVILFVDRYLRGISLEVPFFVENQYGYKAVSVKGAFCKGMWEVSFMLKEF